LPSAPVPRRARPISARTRAQSTLEATPSPSSPTGRPNSVMETSTVTASIDGSHTVAISGANIASSVTARTLSLSGGTLKVAGSFLVPPLFLTSTLWFDGADVSTMTKDGSNLVSSWTSKGTAPIAITASGTFRPTYTTSAINGKSAVRFNDAQVIGASVSESTYFANKTATEFVVFDVQNDTTGYGVVRTGTDSTYGEWWRHTGGSGYMGQFAQWPHRRCSRQYAQFRNTPDDIHDRRSNDRVLPHVARHNHCDL